MLYYEPVKIIFDIFVLVKIIIDVIVQYHNLSNLIVIDYEFVFISKI